MIKLAYQQDTAMHLLHCTVAPALKICIARFPLPNLSNFCHDVIFNNYFQITFKLFVWVYIIIGAKPPSLPQYEMAMFFLSVCLYTYIVPNYMSMIKYGILVKNRTSIWFLLSMFYITSSYYYYSFFHYLN